MQTIWSKRSIPPAEWKYRNLKRVVFPAVDLWFILGGVLGSIHGIPAIDDIYPHWVATIGGLAFAFVGLVCFIGVSFPQLWLVEIWGKGFLVGMIVGYMIALIIASVITRAAAAYVLSLAGVCLTLVIWRLSILAEEARERGAHK